MDYGSYEREIPVLVVSTAVDNQLKTIGNSVSEQRRSISAEARQAPLKFAERVRTCIEFNTYKN